MGLKRTVILSDQRQNRVTKVYRLAMVVWLSVSMFLACSDPGPGPGSGTEVGNPRQYTHGTDTGNPTISGVVQVQALTLTAKKLATQKQLAFATTDQVSAEMEMWQVVLHCAYDSVLTAVDTVETRDSFFFEAPSPGTYAISIQGNGLGAFIPPFKADSAAQIDLGVVSPGALDSARVHLSGSRKVVWMQSQGQWIPAVEGLLLRAPGDTIRFYIQRSDLQWRPYFMWKLPTMWFIQDVDPSTQGSMSAPDDISFLANTLALQGQIEVGFQNQIGDLRKVFKPSTLSKMYRSQTIDSLVVERKNSAWMASLFCNGNLGDFAKWFGLEWNPPLLQGPGEWNLSSSTGVESRIVIAAGEEMGVAIWVGPESVGQFPVAPALVLIANSSQK